MPFGEIAGLVLPSAVRNTVTDGDDGGAETLIAVDG